MRKSEKILVSTFVLIALSLFLKQSSFASSKPMFSQGKIKKQSVLGAKAYNVYYKESQEKNYTHSVRLLPSNFSDYTINFLKTGIKYIYTMTAVNDQGKEFWQSNPKVLLTTISPKK